MDVMEKNMHERMMYIPSFALDKVKEKSNKLYFVIELYQSSLMMLFHIGGS